MFGHSFGMLARPKQQKHVSEMIGIVNGVEKDYLTQIGEEHPHSIQFQFAPSISAGIYVTHWNAYCYVPKSSPEKLEWVKYLFNKMKTERKDKVSKVQAYLLADSTTQHPNEGAYKGLEPLANWRPVFQCITPDKGAYGSAVADSVKLPFSTRAKMHEGGFGSRWGHLF